MTDKEYIPLIPTNNDAEYVVFYYPSMESIGKQLISKSPKTYRRGGITWDKFPDNTPNITFEHEAHLKNKRIIFIMSLYDEDIMSQVSMMKVFPRQGILSLDVYLPFFHVGTMERVDEFGPNVLATADTLSSILSSDIQQTKEGPTRLHIYDLHTLQNKFYYNNCISIEMETGIDLLRNVLKHDTIIVFPDDGAKKRFGGFFPDNVILECAKKRIENKRIITVENFDTMPLLQQRTQAIIIDDLVQSGGTINECRKALLLLGFTDISVYVTHVVFPNDSHKQFIDQENGFTNFYHTNSNPDVAKKLTMAPFKCLQIEDSIDAIHRPMCIFNEPFIKRIYVASTSICKLQATQFAFEKQYKCLCEVFGIDIPSNVSKQPRGEETIDGCNNRMVGLKQYIDQHGLKADYLVAIENGIFIIGDNAYDKAIVKIIHIGHEIKSIVSEAVEFPYRYVLEAEEKNTTVGKLLLRDYGYSATDWHKHYGNKKTRCDLISNAIMKYW
jgi:non-canonical (house-cleaning) NTP pyrophosphatase/phosphoribosylpyrophosphate synthetase